jgi:hypothetical protein
MLCYCQEDPPMRKTVISLVTTATLGACSMLPANVVAVATLAPKAITMGDCNKDGQLSTAEAKTMFGVKVADGSIKPIGDLELLAADVDRNGFLSAVELGAVLTTMGATDVVPAGSTCPAGSPAPTTSPVPGNSLVGNSGGT